MCATLDRPSDPRDYRGMATPLSFSRTSLLAPCGGFPRAVERPAGSGGKPPVLVVASEHDPLAPAGLLAFSPRLSAFGAACVTFVYGHTSLGSGDQAIADLMFDFLKTGDGGTAASKCSALPKG